MLSFFRNLGFTKKDLVLIAFLLISLTGGLLIRALGWKNARTYDYSNSNAEFEQHLNSAFSKIDLTEEQLEKVNRIKEYSDSLINEKENNTKLKNGEIPSKKININLALIDDLQLLPGIGEATAERIIEYREQTGGFKTIEDIMNVKGIGNKKFVKIRNLITIN